MTATVLEQGAGDEPYRQVSRPFFLDTGHLDGEQARTRRQIDQLHRCIDAQAVKRDALPPTDPRRVFYDRRIAQYTLETQQCWKKYRQRNQELARLAANVLLLLAWVFNCELIAGESLKTLKSTGRGKGVKGRWTKWRNNSQIRGELWRVLTYKCALVGMRLDQPTHQPIRVTRAHDVGNRRTPMPLPINSTRRSIPGIGCIAPPVNIMRTAIMRAA